MDGEVPVLCAPERTCAGVFGFLDEGFQCPSNMSCRSDYEFATDDEQRRQLRGGGGGGG